MSFTKAVLSKTVNVPGFTARRLCARLPLGMGAQPQFSSYSEYARLAYPVGHVVENRIVGSGNIALVRTVQGDGDFSDPAVPDLVVTGVTRGHARGVIDVGSGRFDINVTQPSFVIVPPETATEIVCEGRYELKCVGIPSAYALAMLGSGAANRLSFGKLHSAFSSEKRVLRLLGHLHNATTLNSNNALLVDGLVMALLGQLADFAQIVTKPRAIRALDDVVLRKIKNFLQDDLRGNPTMQDLAQLSGMSADHFSRCFKQATGQTPYQYVLNKRIERAKALLQHSGLPMVEIALTVGFSSQAHMNKMFQQKLGYTPGQYRSG